MNKKITSPFFTIPGTEGSYHLICTDYNPAGVRFSHIKIDGVVKAIEIDRFFTIELKGPEESKLAGFVDLMLEEITIRGLFGDKDKDQFIHPWKFVLSKQIHYSQNGQNWGSYGNVYPAVVNEDKPTEINLSLFIPGRISQALSTDSPTNGAKIAISELGQSMKTLLQVNENLNAIFYYY